MREYRTILQFLFGLQIFGIKAGLENTRSLLSFLGNPENRVCTIHIAGTNGKGSTSAMLASILTASGYRTGLYTSPHLVDFSERIRIDGQRISQDRIIAYTKLLRSRIETLRATFFEATTAMAFQYFADEKVDIAVIETGLGGRWDATNVIVPELSIITTIGLEHTEYLGKTHSRIAFEKGGIIKHDTPCLTSAKNPVALQTLQRIAKQRSSRFVDVNTTTSSDILHVSFAETTMKIKTKKKLYDNLVVSLAGDHQVMNARLALAAAEELQEAGYMRITDKSVRLGLREVKRNAGFRARMEVVSKQPLTILDVAHNPDAINTLVHSLRKLVIGKVVFVFGVMRDKDYHSMLSLLRRLSRILISVQPNTSRALESDEIVRRSHLLGLRAIDGRSMRLALKKAHLEVRENEAIVVTGSHYVVGETINLGRFEQNNLTLK